MPCLKEQLTEINQTLNKVREGLNPSLYNDIKFLLKKLQYVYDNSPYKVGDIVYLNKTPTITEDISPGWLYFKNILRKGEQAKIIDINYSEYGYLYGLKFLNCECIFYFELDDIMEEQG